MTSLNYGVFELWPNGDYYSYPFLPGMYTSRQSHPSKLIRRTMIGESNTPAKSTKEHANDVAKGVVGVMRNSPWLSALIIAGAIAIIVFIALWATDRSDLNKCNAALELCTKGKMSNLVSGGNNPNWHHGAQSAGWGGSMHSTTQPGESRAYGASAEGPHTPSARNVPTYSCGDQSPAAADEAVMLDALQAGSAKDMSDEALMAVMSGA
jgi:hypothetical protein